MDSVSYISKYSHGNVCSEVLSKVAASQQAICYGKAGNQCGKGRNEGGNMGIQGRNAGN